MSTKLSPLKQKLVDAGYDAEEVAVMSKKQFGVITYWAGQRGGEQEIPTPDSIDDSWRMESSKSDIDKLVTYWKTTKGGTKEDEVDMSELEAAVQHHKAMPSELESPFVKKKSSKKH